MKCTVTFADGRVLENVEVYNGVYTVNTEITNKDLNEQALETVKVEQEDGETASLRYAKTDIVYKVGDEYHFVLVGASDEEIMAKELRSDMETALNELLDFVIGGEE